MKKTQTGFTLIELVIVIVILGLLAATALPKFADLTSEAKTAACKGVWGGFKSGVAIVHAKWLAAGTGVAGAVTVEGGTVTVTAAGWPDVSAHTDSEGLYGAMMNETFNALGNGWTANEPSVTQAQYVLSGTGGCTITYSETGTTTATFP